MLQDGINEGIVNHLIYLNKVFKEVCIKNYDPFKVIVLILIVIEVTCEDLLYLASIIVVNLDVNDGVFDLIDLLNFLIRFNPYKV